MGIPRETQYQKELLSRCEIVLFLSDRNLHLNGKHTTLLRQAIQDVIPEWIEDFWSDKPTWRHEDMESDLSHMSRKELIDGIDSIVGDNVIIFPAHMVREIIRSSFHEHRRADLLQTETMFILECLPDVASALEKRIETFLKNAGDKTFALKDI